MWSSRLRSALLLSLSCAGSLAQAAWTVPKEYAITASADGHHLTDGNGKPFFWQADTGWLLFHRLNYTESEEYLADRASKGFNMILAVGFTQIGITSPNRNGDLTFIDLDPTKPNEPYWAYIDSIVELAWTSYGIRIALVPAWGQYIHGSTNTGSVINTTTATPFGRFIGQRYPYLPKILVADTNPWWTNKTAVKADYAAGGVAPTYSFTDWSFVYDPLANGIVDGERTATGDASWQPLMSIHPTNQWFSGGPIAISSAFYGDRSWLTFDASQSGHADYPPNAPIPWWNARRGYEPVQHMYAVGGSTAGKARPCLDNEAHYEARYNNGNPASFYWNASDVRVGSWQAVLSGAAGLTYGADNVMQMYIPGLFDPAGSGPARPWSEDIHLPGSGQMQYITKAVLDRTNGSAASFYRRVPAPEVIVGDAGGDDKRVVATRDSSGSWIVVYTPTGAAFTVETKGLKACTVRASWYDPTSGAYSAFNLTTGSTASGSSATVRKFTPPKADGHVDWALVLESGR